MSDREECCGHSLIWHQDTRGCMFHGNDPDHRCPCRLTFHEALARHDAAIGERIAQAIEAVRGVHWQSHLRDHPLATAKSCPGDHAAHDAYYHAARIARTTETVTYDGFGAPIVEEGL